MKNTFLLVITSLKYYRHFYFENTEEKLKIKYLTFGLSYSLDMIKVQMFRVFGRAIQVPQSRFNL